MLPVAFHFTGQGRSKANSNAAQSAESPKWERRTGLLHSDLSGGVDGESQLVWRGSVMRLACVCTSTEPFRLLMCSSAKPEPSYFSTEHARLGHQVLKMAAPPVPFGAISGGV